MLSSVAELFLSLVYGFQLQIIQYVVFCDGWLDCVSLAYQRVQKVDCTSPRPVLLLGPLMDPVKDMLVKESPGKFSRCVLGEFTLALRNP